MGLFTTHQNYTIALLHRISEISLCDGNTIVVTFKHHYVLIRAILNGIRQPQDRPKLNHVFLFLFMREIRLPLDTASAFELAPQSRSAISNGVGLPSFFSAPAFLPIRWRKAARLPELPVRSGGLLIFSLQGKENLNSYS